MPKRNAQGQTVFGKMEIQEGQKRFFLILPNGKRSHGIQVKSGLKPWEKAINVFTKTWVKVATCEGIKYLHLSDLKQSIQSLSGKTFDEEILNVSGMKKAAARALRINEAILGKQEVTKTVAPKKKRPSLENPLPIKYSSPIASMADISNIDKRLACFERTITSEANVYNQIDIASFFNKEALPKVHAHNGEQRRASNEVRKTLDLLSGICTMILEIKEMVSQREDKMVLMPFLKGFSDNLAHLLQVKPQEISLIQALETLEKNLVRASISELDKKEISHFLAEAKKMVELKKTYEDEAKIASKISTPRSKTL